MDVVELRPLGVGELLDVAIRLTLRNAGTLMRAVLVVVLPLEIISSIVYSSGADALRTTSDGRSTLVGHVDPWTFGVSIALVAIIAGITPMLASGVCFKAVGDAYLGGSSNWRSSLRYTLPRAPSILWITILAGLGVVLGAVACFLPGIWLAISWSIAVPVLLMEGARGSRALGRSFALVKGRWWPTFGAIVLAYILVTIVDTGITQLLGALSLGPTGHGAIVDFTLRVATGTVSSLVTTPFTAALAVVIYIDLRVRKEGFDVQMLAAQIGLEPGQTITVPDPPSGLTGAPLRPRPSSGSEPPFWPPPPGWRPQESE